MNYTKTTERKNLSMKEYKLVFLNKGLSFNRDKDVEKASETINQYVSEGWVLQEVVSPSDIGGALVGVFYKER